MGEPEVNAGYNYFHDKVPSGAPPPEHKPIAVGASSSAPEDSAVTIDNFAFMDDDEVRMGRCPLAHTYCDSLDRLAATSEATALPLHCDRWSRST